MFMMIGFSSCKGSALSILCEVYGCGPSIIATITCIKDHNCPALIILIIATHFYYCNIPIWIEFNLFVTTFNCKVARVDILLLKVAIKEKLPTKNLFK